MDPLKMALPQLSPFSFRRANWSAASLLSGLALAVITSVAAAAAGASAPEPAPALVHEGKRVRLPEKSPLRPRIGVDVVRTERSSHSVSVSGVVEADPARAVNVLAPVTGRVVEMRVRPGDQVAAGQVLARLQSSDALVAAAELAKARDAEALALRARERARQVNAAGGNAAKDLEQAESAVVQAGIELERARLRMRALGLDEATPLADLLVPIVAPISGTVTAVSLASGALVNDLSVALLTLNNLEQVFVTAQVPEVYLAQVRKGQTMSMVTAAWPDRRVSGTVTEIASAVDAATRRTAVRARIANPGRWLHPNMYATVALASSEPAQPVVPSSALVMSNDRVLVFVEVQPGLYEPREVTLGLEEADRVRIRNGLLGGERIVVRGGVLLND